MSIRKIDAMYKYYGIANMGICGDCPHFREKEYGRKYFKCTVYGDSNCDATDWRKSYSACGLINKPFPEDERRIVERIIVSRMNDDEPIPGQIVMDI
jgi:hypothetical protein